MFWRNSKYFIKGCFIKDISLKDISLKDISIKIVTFNKKHLIKNIQLKTL
jgi:hypothetical protein